MKTNIASLQQKWVRVCSLVAAGAMASGFLAAQSPAPRIRAEINVSQQSTLPGSLHPLAQPQNDAGRLPATTRLNGISIYFNRSAAQQADLDALIAAQQNPSSPQYHQWLTPDQFAARFGMAQSDLDKVQSWLQQQGFSIDSVARSRNAIHFSGTVTQVEQAFSTQMHYYSVDGARHIAPSTALSVPSAIASVVQSVQNLTDLKARRMSIPARNINARPSFTSSQSGNVFFAPGDIKTAYDFPSTGTGNDGTGQSIAVVGRSAIQLSDIENFQSAASLAKKDPTVVLVPGTGDPQTSSGDQGESSLDLEWSGAAAPGADIFFVYTGNNSNNDVFDSISYAVDEKIANIITISYGLCEPELSTSNQSQLEAAFQQAAAQGQTVFAATGDQGSTACSDPTSTTVPIATQQELAVNYPASSAFVTAVGGTEIDQSKSAYYTQGQGYWAAQNTSSDVDPSALQYIPEVAWNDDPSTIGVTPAAGGGLSATGGGASSLFSKPPWQSGVSGIPTDGKRDIPDVALYSSPIYVPYLFCTSDTSFWASATATAPAQAASCGSGTFRDTVSGGGYLTGVGGTSVAAPIFAGIVALINQKSFYAGGQGFINKKLYEIAANPALYPNATATAPLATLPFHDVTSGNNFCTAGTANNYCSSSGATEGFKAGKGYDLVTGLGSVDVNNLIAAWTADTGTAAALVASSTVVSASNSAPNAGAQVTFTITVTPATGSGTPTGTVNLSIDQALDSTGKLTGGTTASVTLASNGTASYSTSFSAAGTHTVVAQYAGDSTYAASSGSAFVTIGVTSSGKGTFKLAATPATLTVAQGSQGTETVSVTPAGGYTGTVNITYSTPSALSNLCIFAGTGLSSTGGIAISSTAAVTGQLTIDANASDCSSSTTGGARRALRRSTIAGNSTPTPHAPNRLPAEFAFAGLVLAGFLGRYSRKFRSAAWILVLAAAGLAMSACGGGGSSSTTVPNPPKGNYIITFTGQDSVTATNTASITFNLTIN